MPSKRPAPSRRRGLSAIESLISVAVVAIAGSALISSIASSVRSSRDLAMTTVARGLADQLLDEVCATPVRFGSVPVKPPVSVRSVLTALDHYDGWSESPPRDRIGRTLGAEGQIDGTTLRTRAVGLQPDATLVSRFSRQIAVEPVAVSGSGWAVVAATATAFRRVTVRVSFTENGPPRPLADASRIVCDVAPAL